jgi:hypothetical protein
VFDDNDHLWNLPPCVITAKMEETLKIETFNIIRNRKINYPHHMPYHAEVTSPFVTWNVEYEVLESAVLDPYLYVHV